MVASLRIRPADGAAVELFSMPIQVAQRGGEFVWPLLGAFELRGDQVLPHAWRRGCVDGSGIGKPTAEA